MSVYKISHQLIIVGKYSFSRVIIFFGLVLSPAILCFLQSSCNQEELNYFSFKDSTGIFTPIEWGYTYTSEIRNKIPLKDITKLHPLDISRTAFFLLRKGVLCSDSGIIQQGKEYLDFLYNYPLMKSENNSDLYLYAFDHSSFKAGNWWSGMANASVGLAFLIGYDIFRDSLYLNKARRAINGVINPVQDNGCSIKIGKNEWFLEYVAPETDSSNAFFVLNGFLYQLLSIKIFDRYLHDQMYANAFTSGLSALKDLDSMYYYRKSNWTYYMLNPVTIESAHYSIFDLLLFSSLDKIHQDDYFTESIRKRQGILRNSYCLTITDDTVLFSLIGVPHPYWIDVYQIVIIGYNDDGEITGQFSVSDPRNFDIPLFKRAFLRIPLNNHIKRLSVFSKYYSDSILLYTISKEQIAEKESMNNCSVFANFELMSDGSKDNNNKFALSVNSSYSELSRAIVRIFPKNVLDIYENKYFGFELISDTDIRSVLIDIINTEGQSACRYYMPLPKDTNNLVLLNREGFKGIDGFISNDISEIRLSLYTDTLEYTGLYNLHLLKILKFKNDIDLFNYFSSNKFCLVEEELPGNLY